MKFEVRNKPLSAFSHSSLTDIVMLLLIFFLLTSQFVVQSGVKVKLPGSKTTEQLAPSKMIVTVTASSAIYLGTEEVSLDILAGKLDKIKKETNENNLVIRADKSVPIETVIKVIDTGKGIGIEKFTIETEKSEL
jgi:biopolymer transport protein ExbD